jgi:hypothetical protein
MPAEPAHPCQLRSKAQAIYRDCATVAYNAATGVPLWASLYNGPANGDDVATSMAVSAATGTVYVTGQSDGINTGCPARK